MEQLTLARDYQGKQIQGARNYQEDDFGFDATHSDVFVMVLADGMGGYTGGATASSTVIKTFLDIFDPSDGRTTSKRLDFSMQAANGMLAKIVDEKPELEGMGCTFVGAVISKKFKRLHWVSVGDSPFWLVREDKLLRLNVDHSKRTELLEKVQRGEITATEMASNPERNSLTSALTGEPPTLVDNNAKALEVGDILLLASDGLLTLKEQEIETIIKQANNSVEDLTNRLLGAVQRKARPGQDNTTVLAVKIPPPPVVASEEVSDVIPPPKRSANLEKKANKFLTYVIIGLLLLIALVGAFIIGGKMNQKEAPPLNVNGESPVLTTNSTENDTNKQDAEKENKDKENAVEKNDKTGASLEKAEDSLEKKEEDQSKKHQDK